MSPSRVIVTQPNSDMSGSRTENGGQSDLEVGLSPYGTIAATLFSLLPYRWNQLRM